MSSWRRPGKKRTPRSPSLEDLTTASVEGANDWNDVGVVILPEFIPEDLLVRYEQCWLRSNGSGTMDDFVIDRPMGWNYCTPYREHSEILDLLTFQPLQDEMEKLVGEPVGTHLNLTGWKTTTRAWHQDSYLNPAHVGDFYIAAWIALDTVHPDSGPFQYVEGSHRWPQVTRDKILAALDPSERDHTWPTASERVLTPLFEREIERRQAKVVDFLGERGDVLLWHGRLLHQGSLARNPKLLRRSLIAHFSGINHRADMPPALRYGTGWYFPVDDASRPATLEIEGPR